MMQAQRMDQAPAESDRRLPTPPTPLEMLGLAFLPREEALLLAEASGRAFAAEQEKNRKRKDGDEI